MAAGRHPQPSAAIIDSQSIRAADTVPRRIRLVRADAAYAGRLVRWATSTLGLRVDIVGRPIGSYPLFRQFPDTVFMSWEIGPGVMELPDGARLRGRGLRLSAPSQPPPDWGLYLAGRPPAEAPWPSRWLRWPDFWLPLDAQDARAAFQEAHRLAVEGVRVEVACRGGKGRTGTALACIAQLAGVAADDATAWVREHYHPRAVETPWQRRHVARFNRMGSEPL